MKYLSISILTLLLWSCSNDSKEASSEYVIWDGPKIEFTKEGGTDPKLEKNQDKITASVAITRGNSGGEIYNALLEDRSAKGFSPLGTEWALGEISDIATLSFSSFRKTVGSPKQVVGKSLVLHLLAEDVYLSVKFSDWGEGNNNGSFSYERSTED
jgi:hypothetical protein